MINIYHVSFFSHMHLILIEKKKFLLYFYTEYKIKALKFSTY